MGLDMYLKAKKYVSGYKHSNPDKRKLFDKLVELSGVTPHEGSPGFYIEATIGYWRKADAVHAWFVKNVQDGKDECQTWYVSREQLARLRDDCRLMLDSVETVEGTTKIIDNALENKNLDGWDFYYRASW